MGTLIKWIMKSNKKRYVEITILNICGILSSIAISYSAVISKDIINFAIEKNDKFYFYSIIFFFLVIIGHITFGISKAYVSYFKGGYMHDAGIYTYKTIINKNFQDFIKKTPAQYAELSLRTVEKVANTLSNYATMGGLVYFFKLFIYMSTIFVLDYYSGLASILFSIILILLLLGSNAYYYPRSKKLNDLELEVKEYVSDMFAGKFESALFNAIDHEMVSYNNYVKDYWKRLRKLYIIDLLYSNTSRRFISTLFYFYIVYRGIKLNDVGKLYSMTTIFIMIRMQLYNAMGAWHAIREGMIAAKQLEEFVG
ncbi:hypothetical protein XO10_04185 [Marinitoga sp. 1135]|uniref:ABC transmembrane type-1 domain-containing protein n=1 Tax=Marinitoga piezophila (strain DSM 14283 / JCM 11233 / KA3) TaxID=443254 RepID=H2J6Z5_MARPK|nr:MULTISPECIES: hypothetical protein [Marinitoga]AEX85260.1 hypothetical protein Marpi_0844 [Marinitoga piezophila KA3]APT75745.1 hypothetical protein LN42_04665 [Marinitoga sp. 1137]NUU95488.1 hypothetical protein [Marinitoga sp. 1135]